jgi:hypothetical protein
VPATGLSTAGCRNDPAATLAPAFAVGTEVSAAPRRRSRAGAPSAVSWWPSPGLRSHRQRHRRLGRLIRQVWICHRWDSQLHDALASYVLVLAGFWALTHGRINARPVGLPASSCLGPLRSSCGVTAPLRRHICRGVQDDPRRVLPEWAERRRTVDRLLQGRHELQAPINDRAGSLPSFPVISRTAATGVKSWTRGRTVSSRSMRAQDMCAVGNPFLQGLTQRC